LIPTSHYHDPAVFRDEMERLFSGYQFVALLSELSNDRDFVCLDLPGLPLVIQNFKGEIKAFRNVCSHRFTKIQFEDKGNRPLACRYHGWSYDSTGFPYGMPKREEYELPDGPRGLCLTEYKIETCGQFVFVNLGTNQPLADFLGRFHASLEEMSPHIGALIHYDTVSHAANWKILVENVLDNFHCALLHRETFIAFGFCKLPLEDIVVEGSHSSFHVPRSPSDNEKLRRRAFSHLDRRGYAHDSFFHIHIFPNFFVASNEGMSFYVGHAVPVGPDRTILRVRYFEPALQFSPSERTRQDLVNLQTRSNGLKVIEEDRPILEQVQQGVEGADKPGVVATSEVRIRAFLEQYTARMGPVAVESSSATHKPPVR
jgi:phenylpropionate dioxygenase-like ring-hydroxylating dioxygenase large terminal subunit